mgnify:CR=1 FL=1
MSPNAVRRTALGFQGGQVLSLRLSEEALSSLRDTLKEGRERWVEVEASDGAVLVDLICYLRVHLELQLRAKGAMLLRDSGLPVELDDETRSMLDELQFLERSIGRMGRITLRPILQMSRRDLWQIYTLGR